MSRNPFRSNPVSPNPTGASNAGSNASVMMEPSPGYTVDPAPTSVPAPAPTSNAVSTNAPSTPTPQPTGTSNPHHLLTAEDLEEPPAYTPTADTDERILERGPRRPFQPPPGPPQQQQQQQHTGPAGGGSYIRPQDTGASWRPQGNGSGYVSPQGTGYQAPLLGLGGGLLGQRGRRGGLLSQLTGQLVESLNSLSSPPPQQQQQHWTSYPGSQGRPPPSSAPSQYQPQSQNQSLHPPPSPRPHSTTSTIPPPLPPRQRTLPRRHSSENVNLARANTGVSGTASLGRQRTGGGASISGASDFARDFYAAGTGEGVLRVEGEGEGGPSRERGGYAPPPGPPPGAGSGKGGVSPGGAGTIRRQQGQGGQGGIPDDGRPTTTPVPGHPLLRDGKMLVYPRGYDCDKCKNTGYKHLDPSNPCKKCWQKYAKPFSGPLAYAPTSGDANLQKPLPRARPAGPPRPSFPQQNSFQQRSFSPPQQQNSCRSPMVTYGTPTLPHANSANTVVVRPGDPRIGGRVCWRCGGDGRISFFLIDSETCDVCGGVGRVMT